MQTIRRSFGKLLLAALLLSLPLQGIAATLSVLTCHGDAQTHATHANDGHDHGDGHNTPHEDDNKGGAAAFHLCCNLTVSVPPSLMVQASPPDFPAMAFPPAILHDLFIPDQPQRPPLA